nr:uncharacterized protein LOC112545836 [Pelodiscus sinensis]|eukprot:XP_025040586.1 uncharacterized protein LOC112545836 [Pelodiscus sinensis]
MEPRQFLEWFEGNQRQQNQIQQERQAQQDQWRQTAEKRWGTAIGGPGGAGEGPNLLLRLSKLGPQDDPEAFLTTFERVASAAHWPPEQWATLLAPYLSGPAQLAYRSLAIPDALNYAKVREAILDQIGHSPETCRQKFRQEGYKTGDRPRAVAQRLREWANRWLEPEQKTGVQVTERIVLEQFLHILPRDGQRWVRRNQPSTLHEVVALMEAHLLAEQEESGGRREVLPGPKAGGPRPLGKPEGREHPPGERRGRQKVPRLAPVWPPQRPERTEEGEPPERTLREARPGPRGPCFQCGKEGHFKRDCTLNQREPAGTAGKMTGTGDRVLREMLVEGRPVTALVDSGLSVTLIRADLVPQSQSEGEPIRMRCVHGDVRAYPTAQVHLTGGGQDLLWKVGKARDLPYPLLIGRDWPGFGALLQSRTPLMPQGQAVEYRGQGQDREPRGGAICLKVGMEPDFLMEQRMDPSLQKAWDQATATGGTEQGPDRPAQGPQFQMPRRWDSERC